MSAINKLYDPNTSTHYDLNDTRVITSVNELGFVAGEKTVTEVYSAMPTQSIAILEAAQVSNPYDNYATIVIIKSSNASRGRVLSLDKSNGYNDQIMTLNSSNVPTGTWISIQNAVGMYFSSTQPSATKYGAVWFKPKG